MIPETNKPTAKRAFYLAGWKMGASTDAAAHTTDRSPSIVSLLRDPTYANKHVLERLLMHHLAITREQLIASHDRCLTPAIYSQLETDYRSFVDDHKPLEYIIGHVTFGGRDFCVTPATLIPRPETEDMLQSVASFLAAEKNEKNNADTTPRHIIDIGTGCGVLGISTLLTAPDSAVALTAVDISDDALTIAQHNADRLIPPDQRNRCVYGISDLWSNIPSLMKQHTQHTISDLSHLCIVANLPYIPTQTFDTDVERNVKDREPRIAFIGGDDGLDLYRILLNQLIAYYAENPQMSIVCFAEMMTRQCETIQSEYHNAISIEIVATFHANISICKIML